MSDAPGNDDAYKEPFPTPYHGAVPISECRDNKVAKDGVVPSNHMK
jgi:hypothetical protein